MLLRRTFSIDIFVCPRCAGPMRLISVIENREVAEKILCHLGLPTRRSEVDPILRTGNWGS